MAKQARKVGGLGSLGGYDPVLTPLGGEELLMLAAANAGPQMRGYEPSLREQIGNVIYDAAGGLGGLGGIRNRIRDEAMIGLDFIPGLGEAVGVDDTSRAFNAGNYLDAAVNGGATAAGLLPVGGDIAGGVLKAIFGGVGAKTADKFLLERAQDMAAKGADRGAIWSETGWFKGPDDKWRFEIDDSGSKLTPKAADELMASGGGTYGATQRTAPGVLYHGPLYDAYPNLRLIDVDARHNTQLPTSKVKGEYQGDYRGESGGRPSINVQSNSLEGDPWSVRGITLHELQHAVQDIEGLASGGNNFSVFGHSDPAVRKAAAEEMETLLRTLPFEEYAEQLKPSWPEATEADLRASYKDYLKSNKEARSNVYHPAAKAAQETAAMNVYKRMAGEAEARNVQKRMNMTLEQRRATPPWETQDVPDELQIVRRR